ncbi:MAG: TonB family protein, partial [Nitrosomonas sp.]|uniref:energy transducer TonB n=1 Tax=Nitrosomonas sp. TaxID=42353 RepID=UPI00273332DF
MQSLSRNNIEYLGSQRVVSLPGLLFVLIVHAGLFYFLWNQRLITPPEQMVTLFADLITSTPPATVTKPPPAKLQPATKPVVVKPKQEHLAAKSPMTPKNEQVESLPEFSANPITEETQTAGPALPAQLQTGPVTLSSELSVFCPKLTAPIYPAISRRMGEEGKLVLRVELDETGHIDEAKVINSSGYDRLDAAALTAVKS